ncbi:MAG: tetratricopeptide repeat protein [Planctomycetes bacterium]|nr:tetratricopeptide repeat protein [Planctomycetota bacterium]
MRIVRLLRHSWDRAIALLHLRRGTSLYRKGRFAPAASHLHEALFLGGPSFTAHLFLGRIYLRLNRFDRARQELARARFMNPGRFAAQVLPEDMLLEMIERILRPDHQGGCAAAGREPAQRHFVAQREAADDFSSPAERDRFRALPPIQPEDSENLNWGELGRLLEE